MAKDKFKYYYWVVNEREDGGDRIKTGAARCSNGFDFSLFKDEMFVTFFSEITEEQFEYLKKKAELKRGHLTIK